MFTEDVIVDELIDFLSGATQTTQFTTQTALIHFATNRANLDRVRAEFEEVAGAQKTKQGLDTETVVRDLVTIDNCSDLTFLGYVINEALRVNSPASSSSHLQFETDMTIGGFKVKAFDPMLINFVPMHYNSAYWQEPQRFNPDRFDPSHPDALTPDGKKRPQACWLPFNGGKRICFGKTFAEMALKMVLTILSQRFNFELVEVGKYSDTKFPMLVLGISHIPKIPIKFTKYE